MLVTGPSVHVTDSAEVEQLRAVSLLPWAGEDRDLFVRIVLDKISWSSCPLPYELNGERHNDDS